MGQESSLFWDTAAAVGDGADTYSAAQVRALFRAALTGDRMASEGVLAGVNGELAVSGASSPLSVAAGVAVVQGIYYQNTSAVSVAVPTPGATTAHRVVLQADWSTKTVRIALISSADGTSSYPTLTQSDNSRWEIPLANLTITSGGAITLTDARDYCHSTPTLVGRQGNSATDWISAGTKTYRPGGVVRQGGIITLAWDDNDQSDTKSVTFGAPFAQRPIVRVTLVSAGVVQSRKLLATVESVTATGCVLRGQRTDGSADITTTADVMWTAIGEI